MFRLRASFSLLAALALSASASAASVPASLGDLEVTVTDVTNPAAPAVVASNTIPIQSAPNESVVKDGVLDPSTDALMASLPNTADYRTSCMVGEDGTVEAGPVGQVRYGLGGEAFGAGSVVRLNLVRASLVSMETFAQDGCAIDLPNQRVLSFRQTLKLTADQPVVHARVSDGKAYEYRYVLKLTAHL